MGRYEVRLSGEGGQGLVLAGAILAEAVGVYGGKFVVYTQSYGPESRGGGCRSDLVVSDEPIDYPVCTRLDLLLCLTQKACDKYWPLVKEAGVLLADSRRVQQVPASSFQVFSLPFLQTAKIKAGREGAANMVCLGAIAKISEVVKLEALSQAMRTRVPKGTADFNQRALEAGYALAAEATTPVRPYVIETAVRL